MRIERGKHSLNRSLRCSFVIDIAGIVGADSGDCFVVVFFNLVGDTIRVPDVVGREVAQIPTAADRSAKNRRRHNQHRRAESKLFAHPWLAV